MSVISIDSEQAVGILCLRIQALLNRAKRSDRRILIALSGVPGSGKTTIAAAVLRALPSYGIENAQVVPMDGFHYPKAVLATFEDPDMAFHRRGAPFTFDADAFVKIVVALRNTPVTTVDAPNLAIRAPSFDHAVKDPVPDDIEILSTTKVVIIEGNYTLLDQPPWRKIAKLVDDRWFVDVPPEIAKERLIARHLRAGIETSREAAAQRAEENDIPNGALIRSHLIEPDVRIFN
ncbi:Nicotinamide riboside kinase [Pleurostoma richardsiae]|uniref:Nicotinamide riboside kinase n=1 Tax=Pleurostoma richardsiae TaxID=41990 RepID=A0AA38VIF9_9PEZI|nr:Nicotinamide riboside kinase [Pleurostoma richardsiae]